MNLEHQALTSFFGKRVRVTLNRDPELVVQEGIFLGFGDGGDVELEGSDGLIYHCWPRLSVEAIADEPDFNPVSKEAIREAASGDLSDLAPWERDLLLRELNRDVNEE